MLSPIHTICDVFIWRMLHHVIDPSGTSICDDPHCFTHDPSFCHWIYSLSVKVQCKGTLYTVHCTLYNVQCTLYTVHCTLYTVQCTQQFEFCLAERILLTVASRFCTTLECNTILEKFYNIFKIEEIWNKPQIRLVIFKLVFMLYYIVYILRDNYLPVTKSGKK